MATVRILFLLVSLCLAIISAQFDLIESLPPAGEKNVIYTRYVRRRPIPYSNNYVREVVEVFNTRRRPPPYAFLHDEDLTRFVRCDFDPSMPDCGEETYSTQRTTPVPTILMSSTTKQTSILSAPSTSPTTTSTSSSFWWGRSPDITTTQTTTANTTEQNPGLTENIEELSTQTRAFFQDATSTTRSPIISQEYGDGNSEGENDNEEIDNEDKPTETDEPNETEYYDEADKAENNSADATESDDANGEEAEAQTQETTIKPTQKSFLNWF